MTDASPRSHEPLLHFLAHPVLAGRPSRQLTAWQWFGWVSLLLLLGFAGGQCDGLLAHWFGWQVAPDTFQTYLVTHPSLPAAAIVLVAPVLEELGYRAFLSTAPRPVFVGLAFFICYTFLALRLNFEHPSVISTIRHYFDAFWALLPATLISLLLYRYAREGTLAFFRRNGAGVFWASCLLFGAAHAAVYSNTPAWWTLVLALPQFLVGVGLAYIRVAFGLRWSVATHLAFDGLIVFTAWLYLAAPSGSLGREAIHLAMAALAALILVYGLVVCWRVLRQ